MPESEFAFRWHDNYISWSCRADLTPLTERELRENELGARPRTKYEEVVLMSSRKNSLPQHRLPGWGVHVGQNLKDCEYEPPIGTIIWAQWAKYVTAYRRTRKGYWNTIGNSTDHEWEKLRNRTGKVCYLPPEE